MCNVKISNGAIIAAGLAVTKDFLLYEIVVGVAALHIKYKFTKSEIDNLIEISWWNKDSDWLKLNHKDFSNKNLFFKNRK
jgi:serine acetyltransferase